MNSSQKSSKKEDNDYLFIAENINRNPMRAPRHKGEFTPSFIEYLKLLYKPEEAAVVRYLQMPPKFRSVDEIATEAGMDAGMVKTILEGLRLKNSLMGMGDIYCLPPIPILLNNHHFYAELKDDDIKSIEFYKDFFIEKKFSRYYETSEKGTPIFRTIPVGKAIECGEKILSSEEACEFVTNLDTEDIALVPCPCRTRTEKGGDRECNDRFPIGFCIMLGMTALHFESVGLGKRINKEQAIKYIEEMTDLGLICCADNAMTKNSILCLCCECCCSQVRGITRWNNPTAILPSNFIPATSDKCKLCGKCVKRCLLGALSIDKKNKKIVVDSSKCLGCGICTLKCSNEAIKLNRYERSQPFASVGKLMKAFNSENE